LDNSGKIVYQKYTVEVVKWKRKCAVVRRQHSDVNELSIAKDSFIVALEYINRLEFSNKQNKNKTENLIKRERFLSHLV